MSVNVPGNMREPSTKKVEPAVAADGGGDEPDTIDEPRRIEDVAEAAASGAADTTNEAGDAAGTTGAKANGGAAKTTGAKATGTKATGTKATGAKATGAKATGAKATGTKATGAKAAGAKATGAKATTAKATDATETTAVGSSFDNPVAESAGSGTAAKATTGAKSTAAKATGAGTAAKATSGTAAKATSGTAAKATKAGGTRPGGSRPGGAGGGGKGPRRPVTPVKVAQGRNWNSIMLYGAAGLVALVIIGFGAWQVIKQSDDFRPWQDRAAELQGLTDYSKTDPELIEQGQHQWGPITYKYNPPSAGQHNYNWQRCQGDVYDAQVASEHVVHSLEHGAVWITYRPDLAADQVETLAEKVRGKDYLLMSPFPGLSKPISLQAWGYQLQVDNADDARIDQFIKIFKGNAGPEQGATCTTGSFIDSTGTVPRDLGKEQQEAAASAAAAASASAGATP